MHNATEPYILACDWTEPQIKSVRSVLANHLNEQIKAGQIVTKHADEELGMSRIMDGTVGAAILAGYVLVYGVQPYWYSNAPVLYEQMLVKLDRTGSFPAYVAALKKLGAYHECVGLMTGNGVGRPGLTRLYEREGFKVIDTSHYLEL